MDKASLSRIHRQQNTLKSLENLWGLCHGLVADKTLNPIEIQFLEIWLADNEHLKEDPDAYDLYDCATNILKNGAFTTEHKDDLRELIDTIMQVRSPRADTEKTAKTNILLGIIQGLMADRELNDKEILMLHEWMQENETWRNNWPGNAIAKRFNEVLEDGIITEEERKSLITILDQVNNSNLIDTGSTSALTITLGSEEIETLNHQGSFCFTGSFVYGPRSKCEKKVAELGGSRHTNVTKKTDYLVLGTNVSPDWVNTSFGRKIEKAKHYQERGSTIKIITEETWLRLI